MPEILLHHYPQSPVAEKVRKVLGIKRLDWYSVEIPRIPPKPDLVALTGGYRRTPVMQIGADIYCDSQRIIQEIQRRFAEPALFPGGPPQASLAFSRWTDAGFFTQAIGLVLGAAAADLPPEFAADRGRLYFGPDFELDNLVSQVAFFEEQVRLQFEWCEALLEKQDFFEGGSPGLKDVCVYFLAWFVVGRYTQGRQLISHCGKLMDWYERMDCIGHGEQTELDSKSALRFAAGAVPEQGGGICETDAGRYSAGQSVAVLPDGDGGDPPVHGSLLTLNAQTISILREAGNLGEVAVHFPRVGYRCQAK